MQDLVEGGGNGTNFGSTPQYLMVKHGQTTVSCRFCLEKKPSETIQCQAVSAALMSLQEWQGGKQVMSGEL